MTVWVSQRNSLMTEYGSSFCCDWYQTVEKIYLFNFGSPRLMIFRTWKRCIQFTWMMFITSKLSLTLSILITVLLLYAL